MRVDVGLEMIHSVFFLNLAELQSLLGRCEKFLDSWAPPLEPVSGGRVEHCRYIFLNAQVILPVMSTAGLILRILRPARGKPLGRLKQSGSLGSL